MDKKSSVTLAKLARQAGNMYSEVSALFNTPSLVQHFERSWVAHTQMKVSRSSSSSNGRAHCSRVQHGSDGKGSKGAAGWRTRR
jgi:hypothetical protein